MAWVNAGQTWPTNWWLDDRLRDHVYALVDGHLADGHSQLDTARRVGVSSRLVDRRAALRRKQVDR